MRKHVEVQLASSTTSSTQASAARKALLENALDRSARRSQATFHSITPKQLLSSGEPTRFGLAAILSSPAPPNSTFSRADAIGIKIRPLEPISPMTPTFPF